MYLPTKELPQKLQAVLTSLGYGKRDVSVEPRTDAVLMDMGETGRRAFVAVVNLATGESRTVRGSWGGANAFNPSNPVDLDDRSHQIPEGGCIVEGAEGGNRPVSARILAHPSTLAKLLPSKVEVSAVDSAVLNVITGYTSAGRKAEFERLAHPEPMYCDFCRRALEATGGSVLDWKARRAMTCTHAIDVPAAIDSLIFRGLLSRNKAGAVSITTLGKNAARKV